MDVDELEWMELAHDYMNFWITFSDDHLDYNEVLEIGVEFYDTAKEKWGPFNQKNENKKALCGSHQEWVKSLKFGDIINARDSQQKWYESLVRWVDHENDQILIHFIGWTNRWDAIYGHNIQGDLI